MSPSSVEVILSPSEQEGEREREGSELMIQRGRETDVLEDTTDKG